MSKIYNAVDISYYQEGIDTNALIKNKVNLIMVKAGQGRTSEYNRPFTDPNFHNFMKKESAKLSRNNVYIGTYWYFTASTPAQTVEEAQYYISLLKQYKSNISSWTAIDVEDEFFIKGSKSEIGTNVRMFCNMIKAAGFRPIIYSNPNWLTYKFDRPTEFALWLAYWTNNSTHERFESLRSEYKNLKMWQYGGKKYDGIFSNIDSSYAVDIIGDANSDGKINNADIIATMKYMMGAGKIDKEQADIDQNERINAKDIIEMMRIMLS